VINSPSGSSVNKDGDGAPIDPGGQQLTSSSSVSCDIINTIYLNI
jgi:hypothetical protein